MAEMQFWFGDTQTPSIVSGCSPAVPASGLTFAAFGCKAYVLTTNEGLKYVDEAGTSVGPLNQGNGTYWLAIHKDSTTGVSGWTRQAGTAYLWTKNMNRPAQPSQALIFAQVTVAGGAITAVADLIRPAIGWVENTITGARTDNPKSPIIIFVNTYTSTGPPPGVWLTYKVTDFGIPYDATSVNVGGILIITHGYTAEVCDVTVSLRAAGDTIAAGNYIFQTVETQHPMTVLTPTGQDQVPTGGQRTPAFAVVPVRNGAFELQWNGLPDPFIGQHPLHCSFGINLSLQGYTRPGIPATTVGAVVLPGGGAGGHVIQDENVTLPARSKLNFEGASIACSDDVANDATDCVFVPGGGALPGPIATGMLAVTNLTPLTTVGRTIQGTTNQIAVSNGDGLGGNPLLSIAPNPVLPGTTQGTFSGPLSGNVTGTASAATQLAANPPNCPVAGQVAAGIDATGAAEGCQAVLSSGALDTHVNATTAHGSTAANTPNTIVQRDATGNFSAGTITATTFSGPLLGNVTGNVSGTLSGNADTATALQANGLNCGVGLAARGVNALGEGEDCFTVATLASPNVFTGSQDATGATSTAPNKSGTTFPPTCTVGQTFFKTDAPAGQNNYGCTAPNTWTLQGDGTAAGGTVTISGSPLNGQAAQFTSSSAITGVGTTGTGLYVKDTGATMTLTNATGLPLATGVTGTATLGHMPAHVRATSTLATLTAFGGM